MSEPKNPKTQHPTLAQISSELDILELLIEHAPLKTEWQKIDDIQMLFEQLSLGEEEEEQFEALYKQYENLTREPKKMRREEEHRLWEIEMAKDAIEWEQLKAEGERLKAEDAQLEKEIATLDLLLAENSFYDRPV